MSFKKHLPIGLEKKTSISENVKTLKIDASANLTVDNNSDDLVTDSDSWGISLREDSSVKDTVISEPEDPEDVHKEDDELQDTLLLDGSNKLFDYNFNSPHGGHPNANDDQSPTVSDAPEKVSVVSKSEKAVVMVSQVTPEIGDVSGESSQDLFIPSSPIITSKRKKTMRKKIVDPKLIKSPSERDNYQSSSSAKTPDPVTTAQCPICMKEMNMKKLDKHAAECDGEKVTR